MLEKSQLQAYQGRNEGVKIRIVWNGSVHMIITR